MYQLPGTPPPPSTLNFIPELPRIGNHKRLAQLVLRAAVDVYLRGEVLDANHMNSRLGSIFLHLSCTQIDGEAAF